MAHKHESIFCKDLRNILLWHSKTEMQDKEKKSQKEKIKRFLTPVSVLMHPGNE